MRPSHLPSRFLTVAVFGVAGLLAPLAAGGAGRPPAPKAAIAPPAAFQGNPRYTPVVDLVKRVRAAVVNIHSERSVRANGAEESLATAPTQHRVNGMGTGVVVDPRGYVVTNHHVVEDVSAIRVRLHDGTTTSARVVARDPESDLALLRIDVGRALAVMPLGTAQDLMVGETVVAIGNAYGYDHTVSVGVVSAVKRDVTLNKEVSYKGLIQTDAAINPGNSGGPLLNVKGELVGVNVAIRAGAQGIGFAIPVDSVMRVAAEMLAGRGPDGAGHGLTLRDRVTTPDDRPFTRDLVVEGVEAGSPAARAGLGNGDVLLKVDGQPVSSRLELERALLGKSAGAKLAVEFRRNGLDQRAELALRGAPAERAAGSGADMVWGKFGLKLERATAEVVSRTNQQLHGGLSVTEVRAGGPAAKAGIQPGDILVGLHQWEMLSLDNVVYVLTHPDLATFSPLRFYIIRNGQVHRGWLAGVD